MRDGKVAVRLETQGVAVVHSRTVESTDALEGTPTFGDVPSGAFTAQRL